VNKPLRIICVAFATQALAGCSRNPNVEIVGSYFPGWMVSLLIAVALTGVSHVVLRRQGLVHAVGHPALIYPSMVVLFTCLLWLCFFA
jgi:uncharacterized membrane protein YraQ (UPF0718 family)